MIVIRGAGDIASGVINKLSLSGFEVIALEQQHPTCVRRAVSYAEAIYNGEASFHGVTVRRTGEFESARRMLLEGIVPILIDPTATSLKEFKPFILIDARLLKRNIDTTITMAPVVIGLGPGFTAGENCHGAVETKRGEEIGRVIYEGSPQTDTGRPAPVKGITMDRVLRSPASGILHSSASIGDIVKAGDVIADVAGMPVASSIDGVIRGLARNGLKVLLGQKIGDIDPRGIRENCFKISKKAQAVAEGVLKAIKDLSNRLSD